MFNRNIECKNFLCEKRFRHSGKFQNLKIIMYTHAAINTLPILSQHKNSKFELNTTLFRNINFEFCHNNAHSNNFFPTLFCFTRERQTHIDLFLQAFIQTMTFYPLLSFLDEAGIKNHKLRISTFLSSAANFKVLR